MALASQASLFDHNQMSTYRYWYELLPYTAFDPALPPGQEQIFSVQNVLQDTSHQQYAILSHLAATQTAGVALQVQGPKTLRSEALAAFPANLGSTLGGVDDGERSTGLLGLTLFNNTGAALPSATQINYAGALKQLTVADKIIRGMTLTPAEKTLQAKYQMHGQGLRPNSIRNMLDRAWRSQILDEDFQTAVLDVGATSIPIGPFQPNPNEILVLHTIAAQMPSGSVGNLVQLTVRRDNQQNHLTMLLDNAAGLGQPFPIWMTAIQTLGFAVKAETATNNVAIRLGWYRVRLSLVLRIMLGLVSQDELPTQEADLWNQIRAGVLV